MNKAEMEKELGDLIYRFKTLKKALAQDSDLSPAMRMAAEVASTLQMPLKTAQPPKLTREQVLVKAKELLEQQHSQRLANQLQKSGVLGSGAVPRQPTSSEQTAWAAANGFQTQEQLDKSESQWGNSINNWLSEAQKPINQKFKSEDEERAYWDRIKINGSGRDEGSGY